MAGRRQHYIPRFLQRGFLDDPSGQAERTWLYRKGIEPRRVGIKDVGVGEYFYSRPTADEASTIDDLITELEGELGRRIARMRDAAPGTQIDPEETASDVAHLVFRTAHIRNVLLEGSIRLFNAAEVLIGDPTRMGSVLGLEARELAENVREAIDRQAQQLELLGVPRAFTERLLSVLIREKGPRLLAQFAGTISSVFKGLNSQIEQTVRDAHSRILKDDPRDSGWAAELSGFQWQLIAAESVILPDAVALAYEEAGALPLLFSSAGTVRSVVLSVAHDRLVVGIRPGEAIPDLTRYNEDAAACCDRFFVSADGAQAARLADAIGSYTARAIDSATDDALRKLIPVEATSKTAPVVGPEERFAFNVSLSGFGDEATLDALSGTIRAVAATLSRSLPLQDLDGITIAADYSAAIRAVDRGGGLAPEETTAPAYATGVAKPVTVVRAGSVKTHLVIEAGMALGWLAEDEDTRGRSLNILVKMLAGIAHDTRYAPQLEQSFEPSVFVAELHPAIASAPRGYFGAREAAFVAPELTADYDDLITSGFEETQRKLDAEKARYASTGEIAPLVIAALECVSHVLAHVADWLGHRDGLPEAREAVPIPVAIIDHGLEDWLELFGRDLAAIYGTGETEFDFDRAATLSQHVERMLWTFGVFPWPDEDTIRWLPTDQGLNLAAFP
ncbi:MAG: DUF4238 domain-containing protein [Erythrobacter sp.]|uniref:DUF4238 domain-containing protein n=1 Tax=Erythrobacter sp. TaxID=1042 RepID=UPI001B1D02ED|nr:DUF4238 domain-containing protein [Erythrobacter sp.]MBO6767344.1 DUF4238 domain-containing protein [Erythrobacter sp.]